MKLEKILDKLNTIEKISFSKILDSIISNRPKRYREVDKILNNYSDRELRKLDSHIVAKVFSFVEDEYYTHLNYSINSSVSQLDILIDILIKDGNCIMSREWLGKLYEKEIRNIKSKLRSIKPLFEKEDDRELTPRERDFIIYRSCVEVAYKNDLTNNLEEKITSDEKAIINKLAATLDLSHEEVKLLNYSVLPLKTLPLEEIIELLKTTGVTLYSKKNLKLYIPDEFVRLLREFRGKEVADKYVRRILNLLKDPQINLICKKYGIDRKQERNDKIRSIVNEGIQLRKILKSDIHKEGVNLSEKKKFLNDLVEKGLGITHLKGTTIDAKLDNLVDFFTEVENEEKVGISIEGYDQLLHDFESVIPGINRLVKKEFELQAEDVLDSNILLDYNIKPRDIIELLPIDKIKKFCDRNEISTRGNEVVNILNSYKDSVNIELENYVNIAFRDLESLKINGIKLKEAQIGIKFEDLTKEIFSNLGFEIDEVLRKNINTTRDKIDILIKLNENEVILAECKTKKDSGYNKFSSIRRQLKSYRDLLQSKEYRVIKTLLIAPDFSDDFISDCELDYELNMSLIKAESLLEINNAFKKITKLKTFPPALFMKDVVIQEDRIIKAITK